MSYYPYSYPYYPYPQAPYYGSSYPAYPQAPYYGSSYPAYPQNNPDQLYQAIDAYGQPVGEPTRFPAIAQQYHYGYYPPADYNPIATAYVPPPPVPNGAVAPQIIPVAQPQVTPVPGTLPPIQPIVIKSNFLLKIIGKFLFFLFQVMAPSRMVASGVNRYPRYAVSDLTERGSVVSLSPRDALRSVQYYDHLRRSYH